MGVVERCGVSPLQLLVDAGVPARLLELEERLVDTAVLLRLWQAAMRLTRDELLGLHSGMDANPSSLGILGQVIMTSATLGEAVKARARFAGLVRHVTRVEVVHRPPWISVQIHVPSECDELLRPVVERDLALIASFARFLTYPEVHDGLRPRELSVRHRAPFLAGEYQRLLRAPVHFGQAENKAVFHEDLLAVPLRFAHAGLHKSFVEHAEKLERERARETGLADQVQLFLHAKLPASVPTENEVARRFGSSLSTFQRRLRREGVSFQELRDRVRRDLALELMRRPGARVSDIIDRLGFDEVRSFYRAFRRWTGTSVREFHRQNLARES
jgi:AraC-like DNA-binding protein